MRREIQHRGWHHADIDHVAATTSYAGDERFAQPRRREPAVAPDRNHGTLVGAGATHEGGEGAAEILNKLIGEVAVGLAANVIFSKNSGVHGCSIGKCADRAREAPRR